jgi:membrane protein
MNREQQDGSRGGKAENPTGIRGIEWRDLLLRVKEKLVHDNVSLVSAGIAYYGLLAFFPGVAVLVSLFGLVADPTDLATHVEIFPALPAEAKEILTRHLHRVVSSSGTALGLGFVSGLFLSIWSASRATKALLTAMDIAYDQTETRGFVRRNALAVLITAALLLTLTAGLLVTTLLPTGLRYLGLPILQTIAAQTLPWLFLFGGYMLSLSFLYRHGPQRATPEWRRVIPGCVVATLLWLLSSLLFSAYVASAGRYNDVYGAMGAVVVLLLWFWISAFAVIVGAELNAELEHQIDKPLSP